MIIKKYQIQIRYLKKKKAFTHPDLFLKMYLKAILTFKSDQKLEICSTNRYKLIGNAVTKSIVEMVGVKLKNNYDLQ